jgi:hypothetical protein
LKIELPRRRPSGKLTVPMQNQFVVAGGGEFIGDQLD